MSISEEILRELFCLVWEEGYAPDLSGIQEIRFSYEGFNELRAAEDIFAFVTFNVNHEVEKCYGLPIKVDGRQKVKFRVICKPTDD